MPATTEKHEVDPWPRICQEIWQDRLDATPSPWPADRVIKHECQGDLPQPIPSPGELRLLQVLGTESKSVSEIASALGIRPDAASTALNRALRRGFVTHQGRSWLAKPSA